MAVTLLIMTVAPELLLTFAYRYGDTSGYNIGNNTASGSVIMLTACDAIDVIMIILLAMASIAILPQLTEILMMVVTGTIL